VTGANDSGAVGARAYRAPAAVATVVYGRAALGMNRADLTAGCEAGFISALSRDARGLAGPVHRFCASVLSRDGLAGACVLSAPCCVSLSACGIGLGAARGSRLGATCGSCLRTAGGGCLRSTRRGGMAGVRRSRVAGIGGSRMAGIGGSRMAGVSRSGMTGIGCGGMAGVGRGGVTGVRCGGMAGIGGGRM